MKILGNKKIVDSLERALAKKNLAQSYLFCGPEALGKFLVAKEFALKLTGGKSGALDQNLFLVEPEIEEKEGIFKEKEIKLEAVKQLQKKLSLTAVGQNYRVAIIRTAQNLNVSAQNALLKILEEPPKKAIIILVAENEQELLPTIVSRCQVKRFKLLAEKEFGEMLGTNLSNKEELLFWSFGRPGFLKELLDDDAKLVEKQEIVKELQSIFLASGNEKLFLAEQLSKNVPVLLKKMDFWVMLFRDVILNPKSFLSVSPEQALRLIEKMEESKKIIENTNANVRLVVENLLLAF